MILIAFNEFMPCNTMTSLSQGVDNEKVLSTSLLKGLGEGATAWCPCSNRWYDNG